MRAADLECRLRVVEILIHDLRELLRRDGERVHFSEVLERLLMVQDAVNDDYQRAFIIHDHDIVRKIEQAIRWRRAVVDGFS